METRIEWLSDNRSVLQRVWLETESLLILSMRAELSIIYSFVNDLVNFSNFWYTFKAHY